MTIAKAAKTLLTSQSQMMPMNNDDHLVKLVLCVLV